MECHGKMSLLGIHIGGSCVSFPVFWSNQPVCQQLVERVYTSTTSFVGTRLSSQGEAKPRGTGALSYRVLCMLQQKKDRRRSHLRGSLSHRRPLVPHPGGMGKRFRAHHSFLESLLHVVFLLALLGDLRVN